MPVIRYNHPCYKLKRFSLIVFVDSIPEQINVIEKHRFAFISNMCKEVGVTG